MIHQSATRCVIMRGGTSKGVFFRESDLPRDPAQRDKFILAVMGSPDPRQINGLGGADYLTSKIAIIGPGTHGADVNYTFGQVGYEQAYVSYFSNCGNLSAAVGVYAIEEGLIKAVAPTTTVRIYNTNTGKTLISHVPVRDGAPEVEGDFAIAGVPGTGAEVRMDFSNTIGATTGKLLPTGNVQDQLYVPELGKSIAVSIVDVSKATVFFHATAVGAIGTEGPGEFTPELLARYWAVRNAAAKLIGLRPETRLPTPVSVLRPTDYIDFMTKQVVSAATMSFVARRVNGPPPILHKAMAATGAVPSAVAATLAGTVVHEVARDFGDGIVRIAHPTGVFPARVARDSAGNLTEASFSRTARRIMEGTAYVPKAVLAA
jgi:2-methylaconitate cis-trans-isomerase PrpF